VSPFVRSLITAIACACALDAAAQSQRPILGLVLGGGGARGGAHIGVLEVLEQLRIPVDCIAGTSMGALVGGAYAAGISPAQMRESIQRTDWDTIFDDNAPRDEVGLRRKTLDDRFFSALEFGVSRRGLSYREGAVAGEKIKLFFNSLVRTDLGERAIEDLPLPLTLLATDIGTGQRVAMRSGNLTTAMRASMSVPGAIAPVTREGRKLVDGGLVDNVPIQEVRDRCGAQAVIAVNVGSPLLKPEDVTGLVSVVGQMVNLLTEQNVARSLALLGRSDIYMQPELGDITAADFGRQLEAAEIGRATAQALTAALSRYSVSQAEYDAWHARLRLPPRGSPRIDEVHIAETRYVNPETVRAAVSQKEGEPLEVGKLNRDLVALYSGGDLQTVDYSVLSEREKTILRVTPVEKPLGPDYLRFGLNLYSDSRGDASYNVRALYRRTWLNALAGEFVAGLQIGSEQRALVEYYQPLDPRHIWFVSAAANVRNGTTPLYSGDDRVAEYRAREGHLLADAGANLGVYGQARIGWLERKVRAHVETGSPLLPSISEQVGGPRAALSIDTHDFAFFPTRGYKIDADLFDAQRVDSGMAKYGTGQLRAGAAWTLGNFILVGAAEYGQSTHGTLPVSDFFTLGGPRHLSSLAPGQIRGDELSYARGEVQYKLTKPIPLLGLSLTAGLQLEAGRMGAPVIGTTLTGWQQSIGAYLAANSILGPIYFGYSDGKNSKGRLYFFIGTP
jgi:NTE family protein